jgi:adenylate cyclase
MAMRLSSAERCTVSISFKLEIPLMLVRWISSRWFRIVVGLVLVACVSAERVFYANSGKSSFIEQLDFFVYDGRLSLSDNTQSKTTDATVVIVDIDENSLAQVGRWPWKRSQIAALITKINAAKPAVIGTDIVFAEPSSDDTMLRAALEQAPVVLGYYFGNEAKTAPVGQLPSSSFSAVDINGATQWQTYAANAQIFDGLTAGFFNPIIDNDGRVRRLPVFAEFDGKVYDSFAVAILKKYLGNSALSVQRDRLLWIANAEQNSQKLQQKNTQLPISHSYTALVPFQSRNGAASNQARFRYISAAAILDGRVDQDLLADKIVLLGTSAIGIADLRSTPVNQVLPGVETHATLIAGALANQVKQQPKNSSEMAAIMLAAVGLCLAVLFAFVGASGLVFMGFTGVIALVTVFSVSYGSFGWWLPSASAYLMVVGLVLTNLLLGYWGEGRARKAMQNLFGEYVPADLVEQMSREPQKFASMSSENRELTMLFADVRGFTRIAEGMSPELLHEFINDYLTAMTDVIHRYGGTVDKYIGDAIMAFWGAPLNDSEHAEHAVAAALEMLQEAKRLSVSFERKGLPPLLIGVGVNTGVVCVGDMGSKSRRAYTVLGDAVNLASRFETMTKTYSVPLILGETTALKLAPADVVSLGEVAVQGRADSVTIFTATQFATIEQQAKSLAEFHLGIENDRRVPQAVAEENAA